METPIIALHGALDQCSQGPHLDHIFGNQLKLCTYIPELGVVALGASTGRVAIISLCRIETPGRDIYTFRLDHMLPFASQERKGQRPFRMLCGLAAGPIQGEIGANNTGKPRRWRLLLTYKDRSVLSYVLGKAKDQTDDDVECLAV